MAVLFWHAPCEILKPGLVFYDEFSLIKRGGMPRVLSILRVTVSSGRRKGALDLLNFITGPMSNLPGCMSCQGYQDVDNPNRLTLVEEWESLEDLEKHIGTDDYRKKLSIIDLSTQPPEILFHTVSETRGMDLITAVRDRGKFKELVK